MQIDTIEPQWVAETTVLHYHKEQIAEHAGSAGVRDMGLLQSALARPQNAFHYNQVISLSKLAACYGFGIAKNQPFIAGNYGTALIVTLAFLKLNGSDLHATKEEKYLTFYKLELGDLTEEQLADWLQSKMSPLS